MIENKHHTCPSIEEIISATKPKVSEEYRASIKSRIEKCSPADDVTSGAIKFLIDHNFDFDALHTFLETSAFTIKNKPQNTPVFLLKKYISAAAILIVLFGAVWFYSNSKTPKKTITKAIIYEPGLPVFASAFNDKDFNELMSAYKMKDGKNGLVYYYKLIDKQPSNDTINYFGGWLYYYNKQLDSAVLNFKKVNELKSAPYQQKAEFMQALCLFLNDKKVESKLVFENIIKNKMGTYYEKSLSILADKSLW